MDDEIDRAIDTLLKMVRPTIKADEALKFTQASLNLAHVKAQYAALARKTKGAGAS